MWLYIAQFSQHCVPLADPDWPTTALAAFLVVGILVSYLPQHSKIIQRGSSEGLSPYWVLLGGLSSVAAIGNIMTLPSSRADMACCKEVTSGACAAALLGVVQIGVQWTCFMIIVLLYVVFYTHSTAEAGDLTSSTASLTHSNPAKRRDPLIVGASIFVSVFVVAIVSIALVFTSKHTQIWADILGTIAGVLAAIQYLPQIYHTWRLSDMKSLSILTLVIQAPGAFLFAFSLWQRVGWAGWSTWLMFIVTGLLQFVLLAMAINYWSIERLQKQRGEVLDSDEEYDDHDEDLQQNGGVNGRASITSAPQVNERTALLAGDRKTTSQQAS